MSKKKDMKIKKNGKVINLTETDLRRIVKKTLSEQTTGSTEGSVGNALSTVKLDNGVEIQQEYIGEYKKVRLNITGKKNRDVQSVLRSLKQNGGVMVGKPSSSFTKDGKIQSTTYTCEFLLPKELDYKTL